MSYDLRLAVKVDGTDLFAQIAEPERSSPTYNLGKMFRACTGWDYTQGEYYKVKEVLPLIENGIRELRTKPLLYKKYEPENGWGTIASAIADLESLRTCIYDTVEWGTVPIEHLWVAW